MESGACLDGRNCSVLVVLAVCVIVGFLGGILGGQDAPARDCKRPAGGLEDERL